MIFRLAVALFAMQAGFYAFTASLPLALSRAGVADPEIGLIVGLAAVVQVPAAFVAGALLDRFGGMRMLAAGAGSYIVGASILLLPGVESGGDRLPFVLARLSQGVGIALTLPAALVLVPLLVSEDRRGFGLAFVGSAQNLTPVILAPLSLVVLGAGTSLDGVAILAIAVVIVGAAIVFGAPFRPTPELIAAGQAGRPADRAAASRILGFAFRREWTPPLVVTLLYVAHWGVVTAYLPQRAELAGANVGLFFAADGIALLSLRIPSGWLADRMQPRKLVVAGLFATVVAIALLALPATTPILVVAGALTGGGAGLIVTPLILELSRRSTAADRGSAFALFSAALAGALVLGSIGAAPIVAIAGFEATILATIAGLVLATVVAIVDPGLRAMDATDPDAAAASGRCV